MKTENWAHGSKLSTLEFPPQTAIISIIILRCENRRDEASTLNAIPVPTRSFFLSLLSIIGLCRSLLNPTLLVLVSEGAVGRTRDKGRGRGRIGDGRGRERGRSNGERLLLVLHRRASRFPAPSDSLSVSSNQRPIRP